jgi:hypothetical protein
VVQSGEDFGLALESGNALGISPDGRGQNLDRDVPLEVCVRRAIDLAHAADTKRGDDFLRAEAGTGYEGHTRWPAS